jgi:adenylyltransferase/sulfurtransferase
VVHHVDEASPLAARTLAELGIPPYDIVRVDGPSESTFFLLAADADRPELALA